MSQNETNPALLALEQAAIQTLAVAIPVFTQAGITALMSLITQALQKHGN